MSTLDDARLNDPAAGGAADRGDGLFYMDGATEGTLQWKAQSFQLVNWGGFEGRVVFEFDPMSTLVSGSSGAGKSTLLDAYIALMMPADTPFNGASNDVGAGRARGEEQRNLLSYLRGKTDSIVDDEGRASARVLRGRAAATWGAVGMTFVDDRGRQLTAFRVYYVPASARGVGEITMRMFTVDDDLDLAVLAESVTDRFVPKSLRTRIPGLRFHETYSSFANTLYTRLGIGANGDGAKALRLLVRIQSGAQIRSVDDLFKEMVLERPGTFEAADKAVAHFDNLEVSYVAMQTEQAKADLLAPIPERHASLLAARYELAALDTVGVTRPGDTPLTLWSYRKEADLLDAAVEANLLARHIARDRFDKAKTREAAAKDQLDAAEALYDKSGGGALTRLDQSIADQQQVIEDRATKRAVLADRVVELGLPLHSQVEFDRVQSEGRGWLAAVDVAEAELRGRRDDVVRAGVPLLDRRRTLTADRDSLLGRVGRVPRALDEMRRSVADASGIGVEDLPFVAELIDVLPDAARWRTAVETVLFGSARVMLVPVERLEKFSAAIDRVHLRGRLTFEGADRAMHHPAAADPDHVAGKLAFKDSPYSGWVFRHVSDAIRNHLCVDGPGQLRGPGNRVTLAGQTRSGRRGAHGSHGQPNIIGFSSAEAIAEIDEQLEHIAGELESLDIRQHELDAELGRMTRLRTAYQALADVAFDVIDVATAEMALAELQLNRTRILEASEQLKTLEEHINRLRAEHDRTQTARVEAKLERERLDAEHDKLAVRQDGVGQQMYRLEDVGAVELDDVTSCRLEGDFATAAGPDDPSCLETFPANLARLRTRLTDQLSSAREAEGRAVEDLERIFSQYQGRWETPNLGRSVASYADYGAIFEEIVRTGLHERQAAWRRKLTEWSSDDLVPLNGALDSAVDEIEDRLVPVNSILATLPFGALGDRLRIRLRRLAPAHVTQFRRDLRALSDGATRDLAEDKLEGRFHDLQQLMVQLRRRDDPRASRELPDRERLLDVRRHVEITAERRGPDGAVRSTHASLGDKSGGESQELVAFIVGAALRFRLGDEARARPRFAPVFLDEGFVKADAEFTGRAVRAWRGLGFQLIVGAPLDKVAALEPHMDAMLMVAKHASTGYSFVYPVTDAGGARAL
jgi:uncharacterized protein YPO0396